MNKCHSNILYCGYHEFKLLKKLGKKDGKEIISQYMQMDV